MSDWDDLDDVVVVLRRLGVREAMGVRGRPVEEQLAVEDEHSAVRLQLARALYCANRDQLEADGVEAWKASGMALRAAQAAVYAAAGFEQAEIAERLGVSPRTVRSDIARVNAVWESGRLEAVASRPLPPVPVEEISGCRFRFRPGCRNSRW